MRKSEFSYRRWCFLAGLCGLALAGGPAQSQLAPKSAPSPVAPGDLSKPVFDTTTAVYDTGRGGTKSTNTVIAEVEGQAITLGDVGDAIRALPAALARLPFETLYPGVVEQLIKQQALVIRARRDGADEDPVIRRRVRTAADRALANEYLQQTISGGITEAALLDRYNRDIAGKPGTEEARVRIIMTMTEKEALDAIAELRSGADFATVAKRISKDPTSQVGGDLGFETREGLTPEVGAVAFVLAAGQTAQYPVRSSGAWFVVRVEERRRQPAPTFAAMRESLTQILLREGVAPLTTAALNAVRVREFDLMGKEVGAAASSGR